MNFFCERALVGDVGELPECLRKAPFPHLEGFGIRVAREAIRGEEEPDG